MEGGGRGQSVESGCKGRRRVTNGGIQKVPSFLVLKQESEKRRISCPPFPYFGFGKERFVLSFSSGVRGYEEPTRGIVSSSSSSRCRLRVWEKRNPNPFSEDVECVRKAGGWGPADTES
ncbi:hypothetical protein OPV22_008745 [Ensete ventricosum]|uniref:Uncharacterized protein n=1 Tax=Ensete ventricosum TaxID=4639 RepID=A0AAV8RHA2_ENSVE|nr:hypothetical protein OPV22_008745 [Ensete ventricosum]